VTGSGLLVDTPLRVAPALVGAPLAPRWRRAVALGIDLAILVLPSLAVGFGAAWLSLRAQDPATTRAVRDFVSAPGREARSRAARQLLPLLVRADAEGLPAAARVAIEEGRLGEAERLVADHDIHVTFSFTDHAEPLAPSRSVSTCGGSSRRACAPSPRWAWRGSTSRCSRPPRAARRSASGCWASAS
jgi:hypothetical protein